MKGFFMQALKFEELTFEQKIGLVICATPSLGDRDLDLYVMLFVVNDLFLYFEIAYGASKQIEVVQKNGRGEFESEANA